MSSSLQCPGQTGPLGRTSRTRTEVSQGSAWCPHGSLWRRAQSLPGRPGVYPRSRQQGAPFRLRSRGRGGRCCAAPSCALARTQPGPLDAASRFLLPAGRAPAAGECRAAGTAARRRAGPGWAAERARAGKAGGRRGPSTPPPSLSPGSSGPDSRLPSLAAPRSSAPGSGGRPGEAGKGELRPLLPAPGARGGRAGWPSVWRDLGLREAQVALSCGVEAAASGLGGFSGPGPGPPNRPTH